MTAASSPGQGEASQEFLEDIDDAGCVRLLAAVDVGRLAVVVDGRPRIVVLNYLLDGRHLVFRTREDALLARLTQDGAALHVAFEVDSAFAPAQSGWSVIASGLLVRERDARREAVARQRIRAWAAGDRDTILRLDVDELTGRRVGAL